MKRALILFLGVLLIVALVLGCSNKSGDVPKADTPTKSEEPKEAPAASPEAPAASTLAGELCEAEKFTIIAPDGWKILEFPNAEGYQLYKSSGEAIQVLFAGSNQNEAAAKNEAERFAETESGTEPVEIEMLGKKFWVTTFEFGGAEQTYYGCIEDGVKLTIQTTKGNYENNAEYASILDTIVFK